MYLSGNLVFWICLILGAANLGISFKDYGDALWQRRFQRWTGIILIVLAFLIIFFD